MDCLSNSSLTKERTFSRHEVCKLIGTKKFNISGYHPQCDGLVEKFNSTLISMLSKSIGKYSRDWDKHLSYLLFA